MKSFSTTIDVPKDYTLCFEGELAREAMLILEGTAVVTRGSEVVAVVGPDQIIGEVALMGNSYLRGATVTTTTPCRISVISVQEFAILKAQSPTFKMLLEETTKLREN